MTRKELLFSALASSSLEYRKNLRVVTPARKHGFSDDDILHALRNHIGHFKEQGDHRLTILIGPAFNGTMLEVGVLTTDDEHLIVHAMKARRKYWPQ